MGGMGGGVGMAAGSVAGGQADVVGYWNAAIVTGADGKAVVKIPLPERSTAWTLVAKGITADTLTGEAAEKLVARKELLARCVYRQPWSKATSHRWA